MQGWVPKPTGFGGPGREASELRRLLAMQRVRASGGRQDRDTGPVHPVRRSGDDQLDLEEEAPQPSPDEPG